MFLNGHILYILPFCNNLSHFYIDIYKKMSDFVLFCDKIFNLVLLKHA